MIGWIQITEYCHIFQNIDLYIDQNQKLAGNENYNGNVNWYEWLLLLYKLFRLIF